ncbi:uncharacterized protein METZ01_LOCUS482814, partial [marine metagenome]
MAPERVDLLTREGRDGIVTIAPKGRVSALWEMDRMTSTTARQHRRTRLVRTVLLLVALAAPALLAQPAQAQQMDTGAPTLEGIFADMSYRNVGPSRGGRVTAVAGHRDHPFTFYMGAVGGGVWKTENYGTT